MVGVKGISLMTLAVALAAPGFAQAHQEKAVRTNEMRFDIGASDLRTGISQFSKMTGLQVVVAPSAVAGQRTAGVRGAYTVNEALDQLLRGTNLAPSFHGEMAVLKPRSSVLTPTVARAARQPSDQLAAHEAAADKDEDEGSSIVVTGYRQSLDAAQVLKRKAVGSQDDILASDIAAFPDLNLAESLQRIPGITITRDSGEGRQITLRGLGPDFTRTQLNGMEVMGNTASGMDNRGAVSRSRSFDYSLFASELFNHVSVQKSYAAEQDEGGIAGTVELFSAKPFDYAGSKFVISAKGQTNSNAPGVTPRLVGLASGHWGDFGALVSVAYSRIKSNEYGYRNWGYSAVTLKPANIGAGIDARTAAQLESGSIYMPQAQSPSSWSTDRHRLGITTSLQYHPGSRFQLDFDGLYGRLKDSRDDYALATAGSNALTGGIPAGAVIQSATIANNTLQAASFTGVDMRSEHHLVENHTDFYQGVANMKWQATDRLTITGLAGYEESDFSQPVFDKVFMEAKNVPLSYNDQASVPFSSYGANLTDPNAWALQRLDTQENAIINKYANGKLAAAWKFDDHSTFKAGGEYKHFVNSGYQYNNKVFHNIPADIPIPNDLKQTVGVNTQTQYIVGNVDGVYGYIGDPRNLSIANLSPGSDYRVDEKTWAGFAQYDLDTEIGGMRLRANAGVRYYSTDLTSSGNVVQAVNGVNILLPKVFKTNSHGWLPTFNAALEVSPEWIVRFSANRNVNRPALSDLAAAGTITTRPNGGSYSIGNPLLKPYKATSIEGSVEYYMDHTGFASLGFFYKHMDSFISPVSSRVPFNQLGLPDSVLVQDEPNTTIFDVSQPANGAGANIKGVEAAFQHDFTFLPGVLKHLGIVANGTWFDGHQIIKYSNPDGDLYVRSPLFNLSKWAANATLYYEGNGWGVRISDAYRSKYLTGPGGTASMTITNIGDGNRASNNVDFQAHYNITPGVKLVAEGINITNEPIQQFSDNGVRALVYTTSGRTFTFGVTAEF